MDKNFSTLLHDLRIEKKLTQQQLADRLFVDRSSVAHWEIGRRIPDAIIISRIAECLDADVEELMEAASSYVFLDKNATGPSCQSITVLPVIVVADGDKTQLNVTMNTLKNDLPGFEIKGFVSAPQVLDFAKSSPVSIAFLEVSLGRKNGFELCRELVDINPLTNVIFLTQNADYALNAWETPACGYMVKPLGSGALKKQLKKLKNPITWK